MVIYSSNFQLPILKYLSTRRTAIFDHLTKILINTWNVINTYIRNLGILSYLITKEDNPNLNKGEPNITTNY